MSADQLVKSGGIHHNEIANLPYTGVSLGWMWNPTSTPAARNVVAYNHIHHVLQILSDGGGIYTLGRQPESRLAYNNIHDVPLNAGRAESNGMFLDEGTTEFTIEGNLIHATDRSPLRFHAARENLVKGNVLVLPNDQTPPIRYDSTDDKLIRQVENMIVEQSKFERGRYQAIIDAAGPDGRSRVPAGE